MADVVPGRPFSRSGPAERGQNDERTSERVASQHTPIVHERPHLRHGVVRELQTKRHLQETVVRSLLLPRSHSGEKEVRSVGLEHKVRVQRDRFENQRDAASDVSERVRGTFFS